jgi:hypothetical protein
MRIHASTSHALLTQLVIVSTVVLNFIKCDCDPAKCKTCDDNNLCLECKTGYWLSPIEPGAADGYCLQCSIGCLDCISDTVCLTCDNTFAQFTPDCTPCQKGCLTCSYAADNCTSCAEYYKLDSGHQTCYFKYTLHLILGGAFGICILILVLRWIFRCILTPRIPKQFPNSVLDMDTARNTYYVNDVIKIGQTEEKDISRVESGTGDYMKIRPEGIQFKSFIQDQSTDQGRTDTRNSTSRQTTG